MRDTRMRGVLFAFALALAANVSAQEYPVRPVRIVLTFGAPGGAPDTIARTLGAELAKIWGQQLVVDPRPGGAGILATDIVSKSAADGYTLLLISPSHVINPVLHTKLTFD